jgi:hypothetical protein
MRQPPQFIQHVKNFQRALAQLLAVGTDPVHPQLYALFL